MFDGIAEHEVAEREAAEIAYFSICFFLIYFYLTFRYLLYLYFIWNPKNSVRLWPSGYRVGLWIRRSWVRFPSPTILISVPDILF